MVFKCAGTDSNPFSLDALAVFMFRVLQRANHPVCILFVHFPFVQKYHQTPPLITMFLILVISEGKP